MNRSVSMLAVGLALPTGCQRLNAEYQPPGSTADETTQGTAATTTAGEGAEATGTGDGDSGGDGDGSAGDGTSGDGTSGDGDGTSGDGDGTSGDGTSGDGDGTSGDGDGTSGDGTSGDGDGTSGDGDGTSGDGDGDGDGTSGDGSMGLDCLAILQADPSASSGTFEIDPDGPGPISPFSVLCDMTGIGGGWTMIPASVALDSLGGSLDCPVPPPVFNVEATGVLATQDAIGSHLCHYDFSFPSGFDEFLLRQFEVEANGAGDTSEVLGSEFFMTDWSIGGITQSTGGDIAFGVPTAVGPATSFGADGSDRILQPGEPMTWVDSSTYPVVAGSTAFRIAFSERGDESEGWRVWTAGWIGLR